MKALHIEDGSLKTVLTECADSDGVGFVQGRDFVMLSWADLEQIVPWLQQAMSESKQRATHSALPPLSTTWRSHRLAPLERHPRPR